MNGQRSDQNEYKGHLIVVRATQVAAGGGWTIEVDIQNIATGEWLPPISDDDHSYADVDIALTTGDEIGRQVVGN